MAKRIQLGIMKDFNSIRCCLIDSVFKVIVNIHVQQQCYTKQYLLSLMHQTKQLYKLLDEKVDE